MIYELVNDCIESEAERGIEKTTLKELRRYLHEFADYCQQNPITVEQISSDFMRRYVQFRGEGRGPNLVKAVVWSLRKFGAFLVLRNILSENPARPLRHPKMSPRSQLPKYLSESQLKTLLPALQPPLPAGASDRRGSCHQYRRYRYGKADYYDSS